MSTSPQVTENDNHILLNVFSLLNESDVRSFGKFQYKLSLSVLTSIAIDIKINKKDIVRISFPFTIIKLSQRECLSFVNFWNGRRNEIFFSYENVNI